MPLSVTLKVRNAWASADRIGVYSTTFGRSTRLFRSATIASDAEVRFSISTVRLSYAGGILNDESYIGWLRQKVGNGLILSPSVGAVIHNHEGRLLLQEKSSDEAWSLPAGGIELGESPQEAIAWEVMEETGYAIRIHGILGVFGGRAFRYTYPNGDQVEYVATLFQCKITGGSGIPTDTETKDTRYFKRHGGLKSEVQHRSV
ncbi:ADP-ribose pyrophosphatase YjhB (NUDIX family) [Paraburkholderia sp. RAU2J]|uniref:NUDIX domain-containing protein n=1 Tax=Paraburkholderia sp. RAU2J TaxID=1938810 RepID=UPI000F288770|nr:NUDIX domain-containing protein [Paraburkholderia sp. RAU2J]RKT22449.1 ADP-ribose pyrophosphatase YjhB (NUDIX family) [Paraburkholderia sp. RAU2J]